MLLNVGLMCWWSLLQAAERLETFDSWALAGGGWYLLVLLVALAPSSPSKSSLKRSKNGSESKGACSLGVGLAMFSLLLIDSFSCR